MQLGPLERMPPRTEPGAQFPESTRHLLAQWHELASTLAGVLADDRLWVNTANATCGAYLAVEANATAVLPNTECGGRKPEFEVIKISYSALAAGVLAGVTDGVTPLAKSKVATFPYMAAPTP